MSKADWRIEDFKNTLSTKLSQDRIAVMEWQCVTRKRKKDGTDFINLQKNIDGAYVEPHYSYTWLYINGCDNARYFSDYLPDDIRDMSVDDIFKAIDRHIEKLETDISDIGYNLNHCDELLHTCFNKIEDALNELYDNSRGEDFGLNACYLIAGEYKYYHK